jgi:hypothetical protein
VIAGGAADECGYEATTVEWVRYIAFEILETIKIALNADQRGTSLGTVQWRRSPSRVISVDKRVTS